MSIGPLHDPVTWYKITQAGEQVAQWDFQNKGSSRWTGTSGIVLEVPLSNLLTSMCDFVPCDRIVQRAYFLFSRVFAFLVSCALTMPTSLFKDASFGPPPKSTHVYFTCGTLSTWTVLGLEILAHVNFLFSRVFSRVWRCGTLAFFVWGSQTMLT